MKKRNHPNCRCGVDLDSGVSGNMVVTEVSTKTKAESGVPFVI